MFSDRIPLLRWLVLIAVVLVRAALPTAQTERPATPQGLPSETPAQFTPMTQSFDYVKCDVMIPMRDGVKLHTIILVPKGARHAPILLTRTPYEAKALTGHASSTHLGPSSSIRATTRSGASRPWTRFSARSRSRFP